MSFVKSLVLLGGITIGVLLFVLAVNLVVNHVTDAVIPHNPEYEYYIHIRDASNCTQMNDTYCINRGGCVHAYEHCQRLQCPGDLP